MENTPLLETERLILRQARRQDIPALYAIYSDIEVNTFLPWFPLQSEKEAQELFETKYAAVYAQPQGYQYVICLKEDDVPIGYVHLSMDSSHDLGYGLRKEFWHRGIVREAAAAVVAQAEKDGLPFITATHDVHNPRSGRVMQALGMRYRYSYREQWQPKNIPVTFRMYQLSFGGTDAVYREYWEKYPHFIEENV